MRVLVILPTYEEAENIAEVLRRLRASVPDAHVQVIDDASPDGTAEVAKAAGLALGNVEVTVRGGKSGMAYRVARLGGRIEERPIEFQDRERGTSKMSMYIVVEALVFVTWWGVRDRLLRRHR